MSSVKKGQNITQYRHTPHISERRRSLFPPDTIDSEDESDLGHISPLSFDSDHEEIHYLVAKQDLNIPLPSKIDSIGDYEILGVVENAKECVCTPINDKNYADKDAMSPLYLSPYFNNSKSIPDNCIINETPAKASPSQSLKTPHDTCNTNSKVPKLARKSLLDTLESTSVKRKLSPLNSPNQNKLIKLDQKNSKVRTSLFPEVNISLPTKTFYSKTVDIMEKLRSNRKVCANTPVLHNNPRKVRTRKRTGQINAGVGHKIRKPKQKKISKASLAKAAAMATANNCAITNYIKDVKELTAAQNEHKLITENKENASPIEVEGKQLSQSILVKGTPYTDKVSATDDSNKKRPLSPVSEPDLSKKFFKYSRAKGVVTLNKNIKLQVDSGKITLMEKQNKKRSIPKIIFDSSDLTVDEPTLAKPNIDNILSILSDDNEDTVIKNSDTKMVLQAHTSVAASENSILLHTEPPKCAANLILSPISQMCDVTSGLALNSPKRAKNLTPVLNSMSSATTNSFNNHSVNEQEKQLFPIFGTKFAHSHEKKDRKIVPQSAKKFKNLEESQMLLDAGQKKFGVTQCTECSFVYHIGDPSDENMHKNYHQSGHVLRFCGWKNERVVADFQGNGRIIQISPHDSKIWWKKVKELMELINKELGCYEMEFNLDQSQVYLYIKSRTIVGCVVAFYRTEGYKMMATKEGEVDLCSEEVFPIKCGIPRIWVSRNYQKQGIGTALMNVLKSTFISGSVLTNSDIALSPPTEMGKLFAKRYFGCLNYLIYFT